MKWVLKLANGMYVHDYQPTTGVILDSGTKQYILVESTLSCSPVDEVLRRNPGCKLLRLVPKKPYQTRSAIRVNV